MKLDRNINPDGKGKYALIKLRNGELQHLSAQVNQDGKLIVHEYGVPAAMMDFGDTDDSEFFVIRLKDKYAFEALKAYARAAAEDGDLEYAKEIVDLAEKAREHPNKKKPD